MKIKVGEKYKCSSTGHVIIYEAKDDIYTGCYGAVFKPYHGESKFCKFYEDGEPWAGNIEAASYPLEEIQERITVEERDEFVDKDRVKYSNYGMPFCPGYSKNYAIVRAAQDDKYPHDIVTSLCTKMDSAIADGWIPVGSPFLIQDLENGEIKCISQAVWKNPKEN